MAAQVNKRYRFNTGVVTVTLYTTEEKILGIDLDHHDRLARELDGIFLTRSNKLIENALGQFEAYFNNESSTIDLPLDDYASDFEKKVFSAVKEIKFGETVTLEELAKKLKAKEEDVVEALANNRFPILVPCHRIISKTEEGLCGLTKETRERLLDFEQNRQ